MNSTIQTILAIITLIIMVAGIVFTAGQMWGKINQNSTAITERKLSGKTVNNNVNRLVEIETKVSHYEDNQGLLVDKNLRQDKTIEDIRTRVRKLESKK